MDINQFDVCNNIPLEEATGNFDSVTFTADSALATATLTGTATVSDSILQTTFPVTINLTFQGIGPATDTLSASHMRSTTFVISTHFNGESRMAEASGTLSDGATNYAATPTLSAELMNAKGGSVQVNHLK